jgi:cytochrome P450
MSSFAGVLPVIVIAEMLGIDPADRDSFRRWSDVSVAAFFNPFRTPQQSEAAAQAQLELDSYFRRISSCDARRR